MLQRYFEKITDPREAWKIEHDLHEIVMMMYRQQDSGHKIGIVGTTAAFSRQAHFSGVLHAFAVRRSTFSLDFCRKIGYTKCQTKVKF